MQNLMMVAWVVKSWKHNKLSNKLMFEFIIFFRKKELGITRNPINQKNRGHSKIPIRLITPTKYLTDLVANNWRRKRKLNITILIRNPVFVQFVSLVFNQKHLLHFWKGIRRKITFVSESWEDGLFYFYEYFNRNLKTLISVSLIFSGVLSRKRKPQLLHKYGWKECGVIRI